MLKCPRYSWGIAERRTLLRNPGRDGRIGNRDSPLEAGKLPFVMIDWKEKH